MTERVEANERGIALLMCLFALLILTAIALGLIYMGDTETRINSNFRSSQQAYFEARAGLEEVRDRMRGSAPSPLVLPAQMPAAGGGVLYLLNPSGGGDVVQPWNAANAYFDTELCHENYTGLGLVNPGQGIACGSVPAGAGWYTTANSTAPYANTIAAMQYKWVRVTLKGNGSSEPYYVNNSSALATLGTQICWTGDSEVLLAGAAAHCPAMNPNYAPVYMLTSLAVTPTGGRRMLKMEVARVTVPPLPSPFTFDGPGASYSAPNSNNFVVDGSDQRSCGGTAAPALPGVGAWDGSSQTTITAAIPRPDHYTGSGSSSPNVQNVNTTLDPAWKTVDGLNKVVSLVTSAANQVYTGDQSGIPLGSDPSPLVTVVKGDLTMSGATTGAGILLVTGTLTLSGNFSYDGVILVIGAGVLNANGGGNGAINGGILVARTLDAAGNPLAAKAAPGAPTIDWSGGGGNGVRYDSCYTNLTANRFSFKALALNEAAY